MTSSTSRASANHASDRTVLGRWVRVLPSMPLVVVLALAGAFGLPGCGGEDDRAEVEDDRRKKDPGAQPGNPEGQLVVDIYNWLSSAYTYLTDRRTCSGLIENYTGDTFVWVGDEAKSEDTWVNNPTRKIPAWPGNFEGGLAYWTTKGGWLRGCWNIVNCKGPRGTVRVGLSDPWSGSNNYECEVKGIDGKPAPFRCIRNWTYQSILNGNHLLATYCLVDGFAGEEACRGE